MAKLDFLRVRDWIYLLGISALVLAKEQIWTAPVVCLLALGFNAIYLCWGYVFNNAFDVDEDSPEKNAFLEESRKRVAAVTGILSAALVGAAVTGGIFGSTLLVMLVNGIYSVPPLRLKRFVIPSLVANGIFFSFVSYSTSMIVRGSVGRSDVALAVFVFFVFLPIQFVHSLEHREEDGKPVRMIDKFATLVLFAVVLVLPFVPQFSSLGPIRWGTVLYCIAGSVLVFTNPSASECRRALRLISILVGVYWLASFAFAPI